MRWLWLFLGTTVVVLGTLMAYAAVGSPDAAFRFNPTSPRFPLVRSLTAALAMVLGIFANAVWRALEGRAEGDSVAPRAVLRESLLSASFLRSAVVSPIVFLLVYSLVREEPDLVVANLLAFQNGFFWEAVLHRQTG